MITIIVCTYNRDRYIYECLSRLANNHTDAAWELIVVNNNSTDRTVSECQRFEQDYPAVDYHYVLETQQGLSFARNRGIQEAKGDWLVFLDDDAMVEPDYIDNLHKHLNYHPAAGAFGGAITPFFEQQTPDWLSPWAMGFVSALDMGDKVCAFPKNKYPIGANMGIAKKVLEQVGCFNTALGRTKDNLLGGEEKDIFLRIHQAGYPILYFPNMGVKHCIPPHRTTPDFIARLGRGVGVSEQIRTLSQSRFYYIKRLCAEVVKWIGTMAIWFFYALQGKWSKGNILILFRRNVTCGLLNQCS